MNIEREFGRNIRVRQFNFFVKDMFLADVDCKTNKIVRWDKCGCKDWKEEKFEKRDKDLDEFEKLERVDLEEFEELEEHDCHKKRIIKKLILEVCVNDCVELCDGQPFNFRLLDCIPEFGCYAPEVLLKIRHELIPLEDRIGDFVYANQLRPGKCYEGVYGNHPEHVLTCNILRTPKY